MQEALRENSTLFKNPPRPEALCVTTHVTLFNTSELWKKVLDNPNLGAHKDDHLGSSNFDSSEAKHQQGDSSPAKPVTFRSKSNKKMNEFNYVENLQKLGLEDRGTSSEQNLTNVQGSYLSFLLLRHLKIRDLKRQCLSVLNYFRSVEKTLTIYDGGLSVENKTYKRQSAQNHAKETPLGANLGAHAYMFNTPKDFRVAESEFMEFAEIENHDDYYTLDEKEYVHVQDQRGLYIVYDAAVADLKRLDEDLVRIASYYIAKDKETQTSSSAKFTADRRRTASRQNSSGSSVQDVDLGAYSHQNVDRFAVLLDIWTNEANFLEMKKNLLEIYYEVYQNVFDKSEKRHLAQVITNIMHQRARFDLEANYFTQSYRTEVSCLYKQCRIVKLILDKMVRASTRIYIGSVKFIFHPNLKIE